MKKFLTYKSAGVIERAAHDGHARHIKLVKTLDRIGDVIDEIGEKLIDFRDAAIAAPFKLHVRYIKFRIRLTDDYLYQKAKACKLAIKVLDEERKQLVTEQKECSTQLGELRRKFNY